MAIYELDGHVPDIAATAYVAEGATVIGRVKLAEHASVWPGAVIRADDDSITIGERSNIQDGAVLHVDPGMPLTIGSDVTVGHLATLHGCTVGDGTLVGLGAIVYNRATIGRDCLIGAGTIVTSASDLGSLPPLAAACIRKASIVWRAARLRAVRTSTCMTLLTAGNSSDVSGSPSRPEKWPCKCPSNSSRLNVPGMRAAAS